MIYKIPKVLKNTVLSGLDLAVLLPTPIIFWANFLNTLSPPNFYSLKKYNFLCYTFIFFCDSYKIYTGFFILRCPCKTLFT